MMSHFWHILGKLWEHCKDMLGKLENWVHFKFPYDVPRVSPKYAKSGSSWLHFWDTPNVPLRNIFGTLVWFILNFTDWEHCKVHCK